MLMPFTKHIKGGIFHDSKHPFNICLDIEFLRLSGPVNTCHFVLLSSYYYWLVIGKDNIFGRI